MDFDQATQLLTEFGEPAFRARQLQHAVKRDMRGSYGEISVLPKQLREKLAERLQFDTLTEEHREVGADGTIKLRLSTHDGFPVEAVLMSFPAAAPKPSADGSKSIPKRPQANRRRYTVCLSSQSGCALACTFCATGKMGLGRNLNRWEIADQFLMLARIQKKKGMPIDNVVMMGMGEPLQNYDEVIAACKIMNDPNGIGLAARRIAISTAGWIPGIDKLAAEPLQVKLALSLHAPNNELRTELMPVTKRYDINELLKACRRYRSATNRRIFIEYLLLEGVNDSDECAKELGQLLGNEGFHVNLIAYNPTDSRYERSPDQRVRRFSQILDRYEVANSYRLSRGNDISAACGQLAAPVAAAREARRAARKAERELAANPA